MPSTRAASRCSACPAIPSLATLPEPVEHVIFAVADTRMDAALDDVIAHGARAATMMSSLVIEGDTDPPLRDRLLAKIRKAGLVVCGANGMGFYNFADGIWGCGFKTRMHRRGGNVAYISHSGSGMCGIVDSEERIDFNLVVSTGQELAVSMDEYLDYALEMPGTRAVGLFMETARNPAGLVRAFERARERGIPVVALKVGRTELSAKLTVSHSGAIAGEDAVYDAIFDRYGVHRARDMDELATSLILFAQPHRARRRRTRLDPRLRRRAPAADRPRLRPRRAADAALARLDAAPRVAARPGPARSQSRSTPGARAGPTSTSPCRTASPCS